MRQNMHCKALPLILAILMMANCVMPASAAQSTFQYDAAAAVAYAAANWDNNDGTVCDQFVKNCLHAGGVTVRSGGVDEVKNSLVDAGFGTLTKLKVTTDRSGHITSADNPGVKAGDVLFFYCYGCGRSTHMVLIAGFDQNGNMQCYGHNPAWNLVDWMANFKHGNDDGTYHEKFDFYAVKMDTGTKDHKHDFGISVPADLTSNLRYEKEHPHKFYDQCSMCDAKYHLGWNATVSSCYICNPSPDGIPVLKAEITEQAGKPAVVLSWTAVQGVDTYEVLRARGDSTTFFSLGTVNAATMTNPSGEPGVTYRYKVKAGDVESQVLTITWPGSLAAPVLQASLNEDQKVSLSWSDSSSAGTFEVYRKASNETEFTKVFTSYALSYTNSGVRGGMTYVYKVRAVYADGTFGAFSNEVSVTVPAQAPVLTDATTNPDTPSLTWTLLTDAVEYEIHRREAGGSFAKIFTVTYKTYTNTGAEAGKTYEYKVRGVYADGSYSNFSNVIAITVPGEELPAAPTLTANGVSSAGKPQMKWTEAKDAVKYRVYRRMEGASNWTAYTINSLSYTHLSVVAGKTYEYKVCAIYANGSQGPYSNSVFIDVPGGELPAAPTLTANGVSSAGKPQMKWTEAKDAVKYRVYRRMEGASNWTAYTINSLSYTHLSVVAGKTYEYKVCPIYADNTEGPFSNCVFIQAGTAG